MIAPAEAAPPPGDASQVAPRDTAPAALGGAVPLGRHGLPGRVLHGKVTASETDMVMPVSFQKAADLIRLAEMAARYAGVGLQEIEAEFAVNRRTASARTNGSGCFSFERRKSKTLISVAPQSWAWRDDAIAAPRCD